MNIGKDLLKALEEGQLQTSITATAAGSGGIADKSERLIVKLREMVGLDDFSEAVVVPLAGEKVSEIAEGHRLEAPLRKRGIMIVNPATSNYVVAGKGEWDKFLRGKLGLPDVEAKRLTPPTKETLKKIFGG